MFGFVPFAAAAFADITLAAITPPTPTNNGVTFGVTFPVNTAFNGVTLQVTAQKN